jgi:hypothetical protein
MITNSLEKKLSQIEKEMKAKRAILGRNIL